jgi:hypothetical protein
VQAFAGEVVVDYRHLIPSKNKNAPMRIGALPAAALYPGLA